MSSIGKDKLDYLIGIASIDCGEDDVKMFDELDVSNVVFSKRFYRIRDRKIKANKRGRGDARAFASVAATVAVALLVTGLITVSAVPTWREKIFGSIIDWCENYLTITYDTEEKEGESATETESAPTQTETNPVAETETILPPQKIETIKKPQYVEDGVFEDMVIQNYTQTVIDYYLGDAWLYTYKQLILNDKNLYIDNLNATVHIVNIGDKSGKLVEYVEIGARMLVWNDEEYVYQIFSQQCDGEYLIQVAKSVE